MISINILSDDRQTSLGLLDIEKSESIAFKRTNRQFNWSKLETGRSTQFSVPANEHNNLVLNFANEPDEDGLFMRKLLPCQLQYSGGLVNGTLAVESYDGSSYGCVLYYGRDENLAKMDGLRLADCPCTFKGVTWQKEGQGGTVYPANDAALSSAPIACIRYRNPWIQSTSPLPANISWTYVPSVNVKALLLELLTNLNIPHALNISEHWWMIAGSMHGADSVSGTVAKTSMVSGSIAAALSNYLEFDTSGMLFYRGGLFSSQYTPCWGIKAKQDIQITFPNDFPTDYELIKVDGRKVNFIGDRYRDALGLHGDPWADRTLDVKAGTVFYIVREEGLTPGSSGSYATGWVADESPYSFTFTVSRQGDIALGEAWYIQHNMPDMTLVDLLRSVANLEGKVLFYDPDGDGLTIDDQDLYTNKDLDRVVEVQDVSRFVKDWGKTRAVSVEFDSEEYIPEASRLKNVYAIENELVEGETVEVMKWSEGLPFERDGQVLVNDVTLSGTSAKFAAKKWTIAKDTLLELADIPYLQRVNIGTLGASANVADMSTSVRLRIVMDLDDFMALPDGCWFQWRGSQYVWTSADWVGGFAVLTLQYYG